MEQLLYSVDEAAKALGLGRSKFYGLVSSGEIETVRIGRRRLVRAESVRALANAGRA